MLDDALKREIQTAYRRVLEALELTPRYGQRLMIAEISRTLASIETDEDGKRTSDERLSPCAGGVGTNASLRSAPDDR